MIVQTTRPPQLFDWRWMPTLLCVCGNGPGRHRWGDNACPNPKWRTGNGQAHWLKNSVYDPKEPS